MATATAYKIRRGVGVPSRSRYPFADLKVNDSFTEPDLEKYTAIRAAAWRAGQRLKMRFTVRKEAGERGKLVINVYREA